MENDARIGHIMDKVRALGLDKNTYVFWTTDNGAWQDVYPDAGYTPFRGTKGTVREGGNRVPSIAWGPGIKRSTSNSEIVGGLDYMATSRRWPAPSCRRAITRESRSFSTVTTSSPVLFGTGKSPRNSWFYFTENELTPGAARVDNYKAVFNLRGDDGVKTGGLAVDSNLGWKGAEATSLPFPQVFDLWQDPQERYDIFMNNYTERTWVMVTINDAIKTTDEDLRSISATQAPERNRMPGRSRSRNMSTSSSCAMSLPRTASIFRCLPATERLARRPAITPAGPIYQQVTSDFGVLFDPGEKHEHRG